MEMPSNTARVRVGRLLEIRADAGYRTAADVDTLFDMLESELAKVQPPGERHVAVVDWRRCPVMSPEAAERIGARIAGMNARTERSAALARSDAPVAVLQFLRVIRAAGLSDRKLFFNEVELVEWLKDILTPAENQRLSEFLVEPHEPTFSDASRAPHGSTGVTKNIVR
jgi:hypothetical protein